MNSNFLFFLVWTSDSLNFDLKIGFLMPNCICRYLETYSFCELNENMTMFVPNIFYWFMGLQLVYIRFTIETSPTQVLLCLYRSLQFVFKLPQARTHILSPPEGPCRTQGPERERENLKKVA